ncbi:MAG: hypothetical protein ACKPKO_47405 [Candidatus Fonsibacter sp.]
MKHDTDKKMQVLMRGSALTTQLVYNWSTLGLQLVYTWSTIGLIMIQAQFFIIVHFLRFSCIFDMCASSVFSIIFRMCHYFSFLVVVVFQLNRTFTQNRNTVEPQQ